jgi:predicted nuclease of predicted toxin-antitoxin system
MKIKFLADVNLSAAAVEAVLRLEGSIDFQTHGIAGLDRKADPEVLGIAAESGRLLVTHDRNTMPAHFRRFILQQSSPGIIIIPQRMRVKVVAEDLLLMWMASDAEEWRNLTIFLPL